MSWKKTATQRLKAASITDQPAIVAPVAARGREALLKLFAEPHANVFAGVRTHTTVTPVRGVMAFIVRKDASRWRIAAIRSIPER